jgi:raffinose/stachyose/melibiose transport system substrate-binding protein
VGPTPSDSATGVTLNAQDNTVTLSWIAPQFMLGAVTYDIYFGSTLPDVPSSKDLTSTSWKTPALTAGNTYHWQVVAKASGQPNAESSKWSFTTAGSANQPPTAPTNPTPADAASNVAAGLDLTWSASTDAESEAITYDVYIGQTLPSSPNATGLTATTWNTGRLNDSSTHYWKVVAKDAHGDSSATSQTWSFTTAPITLFVFPGIAPTDSGEIQNWNDLVTAFHVSYPTIAVQPKFISGSDYNNAILQLAANNQLPDVFATSVSPLGSAVNAHAVDLRTRITAGQAASFMPAAMFPQGPNGEIYVLPSVTASHVMFANENLMNAIFGSTTFPATLQDLLDEKAAIDTYNSAHGTHIVPIAMANKDGWEMQSCLLSTLAEREGGMTWFSNAISKKSGASFSDAPFVNALDVIKQISDAGMFPATINQMEYNDPKTLFKNEGAVYFIMGNWIIGDFIGSLTSAQKGYISYHTFPDVPNQQGQSDSTSVIVFGLAMNNTLTSAKADAAWQWIWFYSGPEGGKIRLNQSSLVVGYDVDTAGMTLDPMLVKNISFLKTHPYGWILDTWISPGGMQVLQPAIQDMMNGNKTPQQVATAFEAWVSANEPTKTFP